MAKNCHFIIPSFFLLTNGEQIFLCRQIKIFTIYSAFGGCFVVVFSLFNDSDDDDGCCVALICARAPQLEAGNKYKTKNESEFLLKRNNKYLEMYLWQFWKFRTVLSVHPSVCQTDAVNVKKISECHTVVGNGNDRASTKEKNVHQFFGAT